MTMLKVVSCDGTCLWEGSHSPTSSIEKVKTDIMLSHGHPVGSQSLIGLDGQELTGLPTVGAHDDNPMQLSLVLYPMVEVHVIAMNGVTLINTAFRSNDPLGFIVQAITEETGINQSQIRLLIDHCDHPEFLDLEREISSVSYGYPYIELYTWLVEATSV